MTSVNALPRTSGAEHDVADWLDVKIASSRTKAQKSADQMIERGNARGRRWRWREKCEHMTVRQLVLAGELPRKSEAGR